MIRNFTFAMLFGVVIGTYSSIFVAAPVLDYLGVKRDWSSAATARPNAGGRQGLEAAAGPAAQSERSCPLGLPASTIPGRRRLTPMATAASAFAGMSHRGSIMCLPVRSACLGREPDGRPRRRASCSGGTGGAGRSALVLLLLGTGPGELTLPSVEVRAAVARRAGVALEIIADWRRLQNL